MNDYYNLMIFYGRKKRELEEKKENYTTFMEKLKSLNSSLKNAKAQLESSSSFFNNGGYKVDDGKIANGMIDSSLNNLEESIDDLNKCESECQKKIDELNREIEDANRNYDEAEMKYNLLQNK